MNDGWQTKKLGELCEIELGRTPSRANASFWDEKHETGNVWLSIADLLKAEDNVVVDSKEYVSDKGAELCKLVPKGTLLVSFKLTLGRLAFAGRDLFTNEAIAALNIFNERELSKDFLFYFLHFFDWVGAAENDVKLKGMTLNKAKLKEMEVHFPTTLAEQQRIVGLLDEAFEGIAITKANAKKNFQNARAIFDSHLQSVFTHRGDGWVETTLEKVLAVQPQNGWSPPAANHSDLGTPVLTLSSVTGFRFRPDKIKFTSAATDLSRHYWVKNGDLLITRSNTPLLVGHVAIASGIEKPTIYPDLIMRMNPASDIMTEFLYYQMRTPALRKKIMGRAQGANPTMKKISNGAVKTLPIAVPPIAIQRTIVETLNAITEETQRLAHVYERKLAALEALKKSLLHEAFAGQL